MLGFGYHMAAHNVVKLATKPIIPVFFERLDVFTLVKFNQRVPLAVLQGL
jgi:hypothetical protein